MISSYALLHTLVTILIQLLTLLTRLIHKLAEFPASQPGTRTGNPLTGDSRARPNESVMFVFGTLRTN